MPLLARRYIQAVTGITMIGIGVAFNYMANLGLGPWGVLHDGISKTISITYGQAGILTSLISLLLWIPLKQKPGIATIFDAFWIGLTADFIINIIPDAQSLLIQIIYLITGITLIGLGTAIYVGGDLGAGPRDGIMVGLEKLGLKIGTARTLLEFVAFSIGFLLGGKIGIASIIIVLSIGRVLQVFMPYFDLRK
jgi:uncharacterized membrane protein YczE|tara:strand:+ start:73 stop:654 length:582 start_codon:yes stop_codon:yes gene_type:complete